MSDIFLPLRSNSAYFTNTQSLESLERRIKMFLMVYDRVHFQDGRYTCSIAEDGVKFETMAPPQVLQHIDRSKIYYHEPGSTSTIIVGVPGGPAFPMHQGNLVHNYEVDFRAVIEKTGLSEEEYIAWSPGDLRDDLKNEAIERAKEDDISKSLPEMSVAQAYQDHNSWVSLLERKR